MNTFYDALETRKPEERESESLSSFQIQLAHVKAHTLHGAAYSDFHPADINSMTDLAALPLIRKTDLMAMQSKRKPFGGLTPNHMEDVKYIFASPGPIYELSTGRADFFRSARALFAAGFRKKDIVINCFSYHLTPAGNMFDSGAHALGCPVIPAGVGQTELQVRTIADLKPAGYIGTPSFLKLIIEKSEELAVDISSIKKALVTAEALPPSLRQYFLDKGILVYQCYGTADLGIVAYESEAQEGMIVDEGVILEIVSPGTGEPVAEGDVGEIVVSTLNPDYPLIRYATGDLSAILPGASSCGRTASRIKGWMGRSDQSAKVKGMFIHPHQVAEVTKRFDSITAARVVIDSVDHVDQFKFLVEVSSDSEGLSESIDKAIREVFKLRGQTEIVAENMIPRDGLQIEDIRKFD